MVLCFLHSNQLGQIIDRCFAGAIGNLRNIRHDTTHRRDVYDAAAFLICHIPHSSLTCQKDTPKIHIHGVQKDCWVSMCKIQIFSGIRSTEIIDQHIDPSCIPHHIFNHGAEGFRFRSIIEYTVHIAAVSIQ